LASGPAPTRQAVAPLLGVHRHTLGPGLAIYEAGGRAAWLALDVPAGQPLALPPDVPAAIEQALRRPAGVAADEALRPWVRQTYPLEVNEHPRSTSVRTRFRTKLKVPRPSPPKNPDAMPAWPATCGERRQAVIPPETPRPVRVFRQDGRRVGLLTVRRLPAAGVQPVGLLPHPVGGCSLDGAGAPTTGARCFLAWPSLHADPCRLVLDTFAPAFPDSWNILRSENRGAHPAHRRRWPAHVQPVGLPPYCPELHPRERVWRDVQDDLAWAQCTALDAQQA
jgi:hypothetical protein